MSMEAQTELLREEEKLRLKALQEQNEKKAARQYESAPPVSFAELAGSKPSM
jgi:hypothetical protein